MGPGHLTLVNDGYIYDTLRRWYVHTNWKGFPGILPPKPWGITEKESLLAERDIESLTEISNGQDSL